MRYNCTSLTGIPQVRWVVCGLAADLLGVGRHARRPNVGDGVRADGGDPAALGASRPDARRESRRGRPHRATMESSGADTKRPDLGCNGVSVRPAASRDELEQAYRLVYASYRRRDYIDESQSGIRVSIYNAFPSTVTFVSVLEETVIATVTLVPDSPVGLPMDEIYHEEVAGLRRDHRRLAEVTMLADRRSEVRRALPMLLLLMKRVFDYATLVLDADDLCITINPRHEGYYERYLMFRPLGGLREYPSVRGNPALAKRLDLRQSQQDKAATDELVELFLANRTPPHLLADLYRMTPEDLEYFFVRRSPVFMEASEEAVRCLQSFYPDCPWDEWASFV